MCKRKPSDKSFLHCRSSIALSYILLCHPTLSAARLSNGGNSRLHLAAPTETAILEGSPSPSRKRCLHSCYFGREKVLRIDFLESLLLYLLFLWGTHSYRYRTCAQTHGPTSAVECWTASSECRTFRLKEIELRLWGCEQTWEFLNYCTEILVLKSGHSPVESCTYCLSLHNQFGIGKSTEAEWWWRSPRPPAKLSFFVYLRLE